MADPIDKDPNYWVLSIDDDPFLRLGLENALGQTKDIEFSSASSKTEGMKLFVNMWNNSSEDPTGQRPRPRVEAKSQRKRAFVLVSYARSTYIAQKGTLIR